MTLSAIMPLNIHGSYGTDDLRRSEILFRTLTAFTEPGFFQVFLVVVPDPQVCQVRAFYASKWQHLGVTVVSEDSLLPELKRHRSIRGWRIQQLIKLAAPRVLKTPYYMTFDADVICLKPLSMANLIIDNKAILQFESRSLHPKWWKSSARILKMDPNVGEPDVGMSVTPAVLSNELSQSLCDEITCLERKNWVDALCSLHYPKSPVNWRLSRYLKLKWTEYSLYYLNALKQKKLNEYHVVAGRGNVVQLLMIHDSHPFEYWQPEKNFSSHCPGMFCVVGSKSFLPPEVVWNKISQWVPIEEAMFAAASGAK